MSQLLSANIKEENTSRSTEKKTLSVWMIHVFKIIFLMLTFVLMTSTTNAQCSMTCNNGLQVSISGPTDFCEAIITPEMMLANPSSCPGPKVVSITNEFGQTLPQNTLANGTVVSIVGINNIGQTLEVSVSHLGSGNYCSGYISVKDKMAPIISDCSPQSVFCFQDIAPLTEGGTAAIPTIVDCSLVTSEYTDEILDEDCNATISATINRTWTFTDTYQNTSTCVQTIHVERVSLTNYTPVCPADQSLECSGSGETNISPELMGYPTIDIDGNPATTNDILVLNNNTLGYCELGITHNDQLVDLCGNTSKIIRTWSVYDWCAPLSPGVNPWTCNQIIKIEDTTPPMMTAVPPATISTNANDCAATFNIPSILATDICSDEIEIEVLTPLGTLYSNGGVLAAPGLPIGEHTITYTARDICGNESTFDWTVTVEDNVPPVVICDLNTNVALLPDGTAIVYAETFDDGSFDNCGIANYEVRRMDTACSPQTAFGPYVTFTCCDIENDPVTVAMQVTDTNGNTNLCMVQVNVQDKVKPLIVCPPNQNLSCSDNWLDLAITGEAIVSDACGIDTVYYQDQGTVNECGNGDIQRIWTVEDKYNNTATCVQWIYVSNTNPFTVDHINWPLEYTSNTCGEGLEPENLPAPYNGPVITEGYCDLIAVTHEDIYLPVTAPACFKILRRWLVVDWCVYDPNDPNTAGYFEYNQMLKVLNSEDPVFTSACEAQSICSYAEDCGTTLVTLTASGTDDCTPSNQLNFNYEVDVDHDGTIDFAGNGDSFQENIGLGTHLIKWYLEDACGNLVTCEYEFIVADCKNPTPYCLNGIAIDLMPNTSSIAIWASDFDAGSYDNCGIAAYKIYSPSMGQGQIEPPLGSSNSVVFNCDDLGTQSLDFWVLDIHGNWAYCITDVEVQDNGQVCGNNNEGTIAGSIENEDGEAIGNVSINITGTSTLSATTESDGTYNFPDLSVEGNYIVTPKKDINYGNGISTFDLVLMTRHILGIDLLDSPYQMIAADINRSGSISTFDIVNLRKLILQTQDHFPNNESWRFVDADFVFPNASNPFSTSFPESNNFNSLDESSFADFVAVKIGDINGNANLNNFDGSADDRNQETLEWKIKDQLLKADEFVEVEIYSSHFKNINGFQFSLTFDEAAMSLIDIEGIQLEGFDEHNYSLHLTEDSSTVNISWHNAAPISLDERAPIIKIIFETRYGALLSEVLSLNSSMLGAEIYKDSKDGTLEVLDLDVNYAAVKTDIKTLTNKQILVQQNEPNPFEISTKIPFYLPQQARVNLSVFDLSGKVLWQTTNSFEEGWNSFELNGNALNSSGLLYYQLETGDFKETHKMILIK